MFSARLTIALLVLSSSIVSGHGPKKLVTRLAGASAGNEEQDEHHVPGHTCVHDKLRRKHPSIRMLTATGAQDHGENTGRRLQAATYEPMRISVQYTGFSDEPVYATQASFVRNTLMPRATRRLSEMLSITPVVGPLYAHRDCTRYDTSSSPAKCTAYAASTDCSNFGGEYPIVFSAAQLGADQVWSTSSRSWSTLPAGSGFANADFVVFATILQSDICGTASTGGTVRTPGASG